jgi:hypothetical protein
MSKFHSDLSSTADAVDGSQTGEQFRAQNHISKSTWNRLRARGDHPTLTWITSRKYIIRRQHAREWLDACTSNSPPGDNKEAAS